MGEVIQMTFEEQFPSSIHIGKGNLSGDNRYEYAEGDLTQYCLDKQRVKEVINKYFYHSYNDCCGCGNCEFIEELSLE